MSYAKELVVDMLVAYFVIIVTIITVAWALWAANEIGLTDIQCTRAATRVAHDESRAAVCAQVMRDSHDETRAELADTLVKLGDTLVELGKCENKPTNQEVPNVQR